MKKDKDKKRDKPAPKPKPKPQKPPKPPKDLRKMRALRIVFYVLLIGIFAIGVLRIVQGDRTQGLRDDIQAVSASMQSSVSVHTEAQAFAQNFIKTYLTYENRQIEDYKKNLGQYCSSRLVGEITENVIFKDKAEAIYAQAVDTTEYAQNQYDITVMVEVRYTKKPETVGYTGYMYAPEETAVALPDEVKQVLMYFIVPVWSDGQGGYVVEDIPRLTAPPKSVEYPRQDFSGSTADDTEKAEAQKMLEDFFKTLYSDTQSKIDYYLADDAKKDKFTALELSDIKFGRIDSLSLYKAAAANEYIAIVSIKISDVNGTELKQRFNIHLVKKDKFFAKDINVRTYNLKI